MTIERLPRSLVALEIEVDDERVEANMEKAARRLSQRYKIPGFRPGKAPRAVLERTLGKSALVQEALETLLPDLYSETIAAESIDAIAQPSFELKSMEPLVVSATVPVRPTIDIKDYTALRAPRPTVASNDEQVEAALTNLRRRYATLEPVERAVQWGDTVRADVSVDVDGQDEPHVEEGAEFAVLEGTTVSLPGFLERLIGLDRGGPYTIEFELPSDFVAADLAGKTAHYTVTIDEVKEEILPELDDEFAKSLGDEDLQTADQVRERIGANVLAQAEAAAESAYQEEVLDLLIASSEIDYPEVLVDSEIERMIDQESNHASHTPEQMQVWLDQIGRTADEVRDELRPRADTAVKRALVLGELASKESVEVDESEVDAEINRMLDQFFGAGAAMENDQREQFRQMFDTPDSRSQTRHQLQTQATLGRLVEIASEESEGGEEAPRARGTRRRRRSGEGDAEAEASDEAGTSEPVENAEAEAETE
ncbi:MAG: trigger factor [Chloroflexota bacterium]